MDYRKPATTVDEQVALLKSRGMVCRDEALVRRWLVTVGYYRLSAYWLPYEIAPPDGQTRSKRFAPDTGFEAIVDVYTFSSSPASSATTARCMEVDRMSDAKVCAYCPVSLSLVTNRRRLCY